eukprot:10142420-Ditylum_brightwellii.AAC.2
MEVVLNKQLGMVEHQGIGNYPSVVGTYVSFLVANSEIGHSDRLSSELKDINDKVKPITSDVKAAKMVASSTTNKADKALKTAKSKKTRE